MISRPVSALIRAQWLEQTMYNSREFHIDRMNTSNSLVSHLVFWGRVPGEIERAHAGMAFAPKDFSSKTLRLSNISSSTSISSSASWGCPVAIL